MPLYKYKIKQNKFKTVALFKINPLLGGAAERFHGFCSESIPQRVP